MIPHGYVLITEKELIELHSLRELVNDLRNQIEELKKQLAKGSHNSHKPPSSDGYKKKVIKNNREQSDKKQGAQSGHQGTTLQMTDHPDRIIEKKVKLDEYCQCGQSLKEGEPLGYHRRQEIELLKKLTETIEYRIEAVRCSCGKVHYGEGQRLIPIQYGTTIKALAVYLNLYQYLPFERIQEYFKDWLQISISDGFLQKANEQCYNNLEETERQIKQRLMEQPVIHNDETGIRCQEKLQWIHNTSTGQFTHYSLQSKRGKEAMDNIDILPNYKGNSVHDRFSSYNDYECEHSNCNAHLCRDLKYVHEEERKSWAAVMIAILIDAKEKKQTGQLNEQTLATISRNYDKVINDNIMEESIPEKPPEKKRGRARKSPSLLLLEFFQNSKEQVLKFVFDPLVPFDNNQAERDLRMVKLKQKISGCFRTKKGGEVFCRIRSYISTVRKQQYKVVEALWMAIEGNPISFETVAEQ